MKSKIFKFNTLVQIVISVFCVFVISSLSANTAQAATNTSALNFQARLLTSAGAVVPDGNYNVDFKIYNTAIPSAGTVGTCTGNCLWEETYAYGGYAGGTVTIGPQLVIKNGYITVNLGAYSTFATYALTNWSQQLYLSMNIGGTTSSGAITWDGEMGNGGPLSLGNSLLSLTGVPVAFSANQLQTNNTGGLQALVFASGTSAGTITLPDVAGFAVIAQSGTPTSVTGNTAISGYSSANNFVAAAASDALDVAAAGALNIGSTTATSIQFGNSTTTAITAKATSSLQVQNATSGTSILNANIASSNVSMDALVAPGIITATLPPIINAPTTTGTVGVVSYSYEVQAAGPNGSLTYPSPTSTIATGNATLSSANFNNITWGTVAGATNYYIYRTASGGTPSSTGLIGAVNTIASGGTPTSYVSSGTSLTLTFASVPSWVVGQKVTLSGFTSTPTTFNGTWPITAITSTTVTLYISGGATSTISVEGTVVGTLGFSDIATVATGTSPVNTIGTISAIPYYFKVTTIDSTGGQTVASSTEAIATASSATSLAITLSWVPVTGARGYNVYYATSSGAETHGYFTTYTNSYTFTATAGTTAGSIPTVSTAYNDTLSTTGNSQITLGNTANSGSLAQLDVAGNTPTSAVGSVATGTNPYSVYVQGSYAYVTNWSPSTLQIINISNPSFPVVVGTVTTGAQPYSVYVQGSYAYVTNWTSTTLQIINISNPSSPVVVGTVTTGYQTYSITVQGNYAYVTNWGAATLQIINISNPSSPVVVGTVATGTNPSSVYVQGRYAYVTNSGSATLQIINISNPSSPVVVGTVTTGTNSQSVYVQGNYAYVANNGSASLQIINISNPSSPVVVGTVTTGTNPISVYVQGNYAYVANNGSASLQIINISNPSSPVVVGTVTTGTTPSSVYVQGRYAYVTNYGSSTLQIFDLGGAYIQQLQAGGTETGTLTVDTNSQVNGSESVVGSLGVGSSLSVGGSAAVTTSSINALQVQSTTANVLNVNTSSGAVNMNALTAPGTVTATLPPTISATTTTGTAGSTSYTYEVVAVGSNGSTGYPSPTNTVTTGNAALSASNYNNISWGAVSGATNYYVYRTASGGTPSSTGLIGVIPSGTTTLSDRGLTATGFAPALTGALTNAQTYYFKVTTIDSTGGQTVASIETSATATTATNLAINLSWAPVTGARGYNVYYGTSSGAETNGYFTTYTNSYNFNNSIYTPTSGSETGTVLTLNMTAVPGVWQVGQSLTLAGFTMNTGSVNGTWTIASVSSTVVTLTITGGVTSTISTMGTVTATTTGTIPTVSTAYNDTLSTTGNSQITLGNTVGSASTAQLDVAGNVSTSAVGSVTTGTQPISVYVQGSYAYVANNGSASLQIINISNPSSPIVVGIVTTGNNPQSVYVQGSYAYVANYGSNSLQIINISNPSSPVVVGTVTTGTNPNSVYVQGRYAYVANGNPFTLQVIDISNPSSPVVVGTVTTGTNPFSVYVQGNYAYVANVNSNSLQVIDISNPSSPVVVGTVTTGTNPFSVYVQGNYAYVANGGSNSLQVINISNPRSPVVVGTVTTGTNPFSVYVQGNYAYVANINSNSLQVIDISNPSSPVVVGTVTTGTNPEPVYVQGRYAYVANHGSNILQIFDLGGAYIQQLQAGGTETGTLTVDTNSQVNGSESIVGSLGVGTTLQVAGAAGLGGLVVSGLTTPAAPTVAATGTLGSTIYAYAITANNVSGSSALSTPTSIANGATTLNNSTSYVETSWSAITGVSSYSIYRTTGGAAQGLISTIGNTSTLTPTSATQSGTVATLNFSTPPSWAVGQAITLSGFTSTGTINGTWPILTVTATSITVNITGGATSTISVMGTATGILGFFDTATAATGTVPTSGTAGTIGFASSTGNTVTIGVSATTAAYSITLPTAAPGTNQCLLTGSTTASLLTFGSCSGGTSINNQYATTQTNANFNIQGVSGQVTAVIQANGADILDLKNASAVIVDSVSSTGNVSIGTVGSIGTTTSQLFVGGNIPTSNIGSVGTGSTPRTVYVQGQYAYVANQTGNTLQVINISNPASPVVVGTSATTGLNAPYSIYVQGKYAYVANEGGSTLQVFDVSYPANPVSVGSAATGTNPNSVYVQGKYAYVATNTATTGFQIFDVSNPANPVMVASSVTNSNSSAVSVQSHYAYILSGNTFQIFDVSNPANPVSMGSVVIGNGPYSLYIQGGYAYVANYTSNTLQVINISNPASPVVAGTSATTGLSAPYSIYAQGRYAYVANQTGNTLQIFDVSNPASPVSIGSINTGTVTPMSVNIQGRYAYLVNYNSTLQIYDLGGSYVQQLQAGGTETGTLTVDANSQINGSESVVGSLGVGSSLNVSGSAALGGLVINGLATPTAPTVTPTGTTGTTSYTYAIVAFNSSGQSAASSTTTTNTGNQTLGGSNYNAIAWTAVSGATGYNIYRTATSGKTPGNTTGLVGNVYAPTLAFNDTGAITGNGAAAPTIATAGVTTIATNSINAFQIQNAAGTNILNVNTASGAINMNAITAPGTITQTVDNSAAYAPTSALTGTTGAATYIYKEVPVAANGATTPLISAASTSITTGNANMSTSNYITITPTIPTYTGLAPVGYYIYRTTATGAVGTSATTGLIGYATAGGTLIDFGQTAGTAAPTTTGNLASATYYVKVTAIDGTGGQTVPSTEASIATGAASTALTYSWAPVTGARGYNIYVGTTSNQEVYYGTTSLDNGFTIGTSLTTPGVLAPSTATSGGTLPQSTTYYYKIIALDAIGDITALSAEASQATGATGPNNTISLSWTAVSNATSYQIYKGTTSGGENQYFSVTTNAFTDTGATGTTATLPSTSTAFNNTLSTTGNSQITLGNTANSGSVAQLDVAGNVPIGAVGVVATAINPWAVFTQGSYAYIINSGSSTLQVINISNPASPVVVGSATVTSGPHGVYVQGRYAYVANYSSATLQIFDISNPTNPVVVGSVTTGSQPMSIYVQGRYAYVANSGSGTLQVIDISNPSNPLIVGSVTTGTNPQAIYVQGRYAYVTNYSSATLQIFDISNPTNPVVVGTVTTGTAPKSVYVQGSYAYVVNGISNSLQIFDVSNPSSPTNVGSATTGLNSPDAVYVQNRYAYIINYTSGTLQIFDVSNPSSPTNVGSATTGTNPNSVYVQGRYAFVANTGSNTLQIFDLGGAYIQQFQAGGTETGTLTVDANSQINGSESVVGSLGVGSSLSVAGSISAGAGGLAISGIATPIATETVTCSGTCATIYGYQVAASNNSSSSISAAVSTGATANATLNTTTEYNQTSWSPIAGANSYNIYRTTGGAAQGLIGSVNTTTLAVPTSGSETGATLTLNFTATPAWVVGQGITLSNFVMNTGSINGTWPILSVTSTSITVNILGGVTSTISTEGAAAGALAFYDTAQTAGAAAPTTTTTGTISLANGQVAIGSLGTPTSQLYVGGNVPVTAIGSVGTGTAPAGIYVQGNYAYTINYTSATLQITDISNPANPVVVGTSATTGLNGPRAISVQGNYAYVLNQGGGTLQVFNISNPVNPISIGSANIPGGSPVYVYVSGNYAYVVGGSNALQVFNISNPASPALVGSVALGGISWGVYVQGSYAYVANNGSNTLQVFNISNPASPALVGSTNTGAGPLGVYVQGRYAYVTNRTASTFQIFDISNPANPVVVGTSAATGLNSPWGVYVQGRYAYVVNSNGNTFQIFDISNPANPISIGTIPVGANSQFFYVQGRYAYVPSSNNNTLQIFDLGGSYIQQLQAGGTETGTLTVDTNAQVNGSESVVGSLGVGSSLNVSGSAALGGLVINGLATPTAPTVTPTGTTGTTSYTYAIVAFNSSGQSAASVPTQTITGNATLTVTNYNAIAWSAVTGATGYNIYRTVSNGTPSTTGLIGTVYVPTLAFNDTGATGNSAVAPIAATAGNLTDYGAALFQNPTNSASAFQVNNSSGSIILGINSNPQTVINVGMISWAASTGLPLPLNQATSVTYNGYIYELGGLDNGTIQSTVYYAPLNANGSTGAWISTTSLPQGFYVATSVVYNGYVYIMGGGSSNLLDYSAPLNANGSVGTWTSTTALPISFYVATSVTYNGYVYIMGGTNSGQTNVYSAPLNVGGSVGTWTPTAALPQALARATSVTYNGYVYVMAGNNGSTIQSTVYYAPLNVGGSVGTWTSTTALPQALTYASSIVYNGYIYIMGGQNGTSIVSTVDYAPLNANGSTGAWTSTTALPQALESSTSVTYNGYVYYLGGDNYISNQSTVYYAQLLTGTSTAGQGSLTLNAGATITGSVLLQNAVNSANAFQINNSSGNSILTLNSNPLTTSNIGTSSWTSTTNLPTGEGTLATSAAYNGYVYEIGGTNSGGLVAAVYYAPLNSNGSVGTWITSTNSLPQALDQPTAVTYNGYIYEIAGNGSTGLQSTVYYAPLNSDGSVGTWITSTNSLPQALWRDTSVVYNGYVYVIGGQSSSGVVSTVYYAPLNVGGSVGAWTTTTLPQPLANATSVVYNGYIYVMDGNAGSAGFQSTVYYAPLNVGGSVGTWISTTAVPQALWAATSVVYNGYIYFIDGQGDTNQALVYYAPINTNGSVGAWISSTNSLPQGSSYDTAVTYNGYVYVIGSGVNNNQSVYYAQFLAGTSIIEQGNLMLNAGATITGPTLLQSAVNSTTAFQVQNSSSSQLINVDTINNIVTVGAGTGMNPWVTNQIGLPQALDYATSVTYNGYVYELGGNNSSGGYQSTVYYAPLNSNGSVGTWTTSTNALPQSLAAATSVVYNGYVYELGGANGAYQSTVYYAPLNSNGSVGTWTSTTALPQTLSRASSVVYNGYIYELGGYNGSNQSTVYYAPLNSNGSVGAWVSTTTLPQTLNNASSVVYNGYIYELDGYNSSNQSTVYYAPLNANGSVGTWTSTTALPQALNSASSVVYNGYIYELGGVSRSSQSTVYYAPLNANGSVGTWTSTTALPQDLYVASSIVYNGYIYELGGAGDNGTVYQSSVYYVALAPSLSSLQGNLQVEGSSVLNGTTVINGSSSSSPILQVNSLSGNNLFSVQSGTVSMPAPTLQAWTTNVISVPQAVVDATSVVYNGYVYELGGYNYNSSTYQSTVYYAPLNSNGSVGTWTSTTALPQVLEYATSVAYNGYIYEIGGQNSSTFQSTVYYAPLNSNGSVGAWTSTTVLPQVLCAATSVVYNGYVYELGGYNGAFQSTVYYAPLSSNGSVGAWTTSTNALPQVLDDATSVVYNGYVYEIGGDGTIQSTVYYAPLNSNGSVGTWTSTTALPQALELATSVVYNGYVYEIGGYNYNSSTHQSTVYYAPLNSNGSVGAWTTTTALPQVLQQSTSIINNGYIYELGGMNSSTNAVPTTYYTSLSLVISTGNTVSIGSTLSIGTIGSIGTITSQLYVGGNVPTSTVGSVTTGVQPYYVYVQGSYAYVVNQSSATLQVINISNPSSPAVVGSVATGSGPSSVYVQGRYAYVTNFSSATLQVINISNPSSPAVVGSVAVNSGPWSAYVQGRYAYIVNSGTNRLQVINISNPSSPAVVATVPTDGSPNSVHVQGNYAYVANNGSADLQVFDISNPSSPVVVGTVTTGTQPRYVYVQGSYAYVANQGSSTLQVINISNPSSPAVVGSVAVGTMTNSVYVQGRYAYVTTQSTNNLQVIDISTPSSPTVVGSVATGTTPSSVYVQGRYAYVTNFTSATLQIFDLGGSYIQQLQAGGAETGTLTVDTNATVNGSEAIVGGLQVGSSAQISGNLGVSGTFCIGATSCTAGEALGVQGTIIASGTITASGSPDYAEDITATDPTIGAGDLVSMDPANPGQVIKSSKTYDPNLIGAISTSPGYLTNAPAGAIDGTPATTDQVPLALAGRIPVNVDTENGPITIGDYITSSSIPGVGMVATAPGQVIGRAMTSYDGSGVGTVTVYLEHFFYNPSTPLGSADILNSLSDADITGNLIVSGNTTVESITIEGDTTFNSNVISYNNNVRGLNIVLAPLSRSYSVSFTQTYPDNSYAVLCTPNYDASCYVTNKQVTGFTLNFGTPAPADGSGTVDWFVAN